MPAQFLTGLARALSTMALYSEGHPARERAVDTSYRALQDLQAADPRPLFTFLGDEVVYGQRPVRELAGWEWGQRLGAAGVQRLEFEAGVSRHDYEEFLEQVLARVALSVVQSAEARQMRAGGGEGDSGIKFGSVGVRGGGPVDVLPTATPTIALSLREEAEAVRWLHGEVQEQRALPLVEAEAVVRSLSVAMHADQRAILPLLKLRSFDEYTTTHALNVAVLTMALAEFLGLSADEVRAFGVAGLLHDIGKVKIPKDVLTKPGKLTDEERALMNTHPAEGARIILENYRNLDMAAVVAYEHHIMIDGRGYPELRFRRDCHAASKLVHICDVYDALRTKRPYRDAWEPGRVLDYVKEHSGSEFEPEFAHAFLRMMGTFEERKAEV